MFDALSLLIPFRKEHQMLKSSVLSSYKSDLLLTFTTLLSYSAEDKCVIFFLIFPEHGITS